MALLTPQQVGITGTTPTYGAVAASDTVTPDDRTFLIVKNAGGSPDTCTVVIPGSYLGQAIPDVAVTVPATNGERWIGPLNAAAVDPTTGLVTITHSFTTSVTCALVRI
ncbi:MAG: hypothetical protein ABIR39_19785 [Nocardioides sp.]|uniref:hypothetical protein n=1 Tax=Nocardioides sp. TaxID=35761 RepID=UPI0032678D66